METFETKVTRSRRLAPERLVRAAAHALANELFAIRSYGELVLLGDDLGPAARREIANLLAQVDRTSRLVGDLARAARTAAGSGDGLDGLASDLVRIMPRELSPEGGLL